MRPLSITSFERLSFAAIALGLVKAFILRNLAAAIGPLFYGTQLFSLVLFVALTLLVSRRRSKVAMWILIVLFVINLPFPFDTASMLIIKGPLRWLTVAQLLVQAIGLGLLFTPSARLWMNDNSTLPKL